MRDHFQQLSSTTKLQLSAPKNERDPYSKRMNQLGMVIMNWFLYVSIVLVLQSMFSIQSVSFIAILPGLLLVVLMNLKPGKLRLGLLLLFSSVFLFLFILKHTDMMNGLFYLTNEMIETIGIQTGIMIPLYKLTIDPSDLWRVASLFWSYIAIMIACVVYVIVTYRQSILLWFVIAVLTATQLYLGMAPGIYPNILLFLSTILCMNHFFINGKGKRVTLGKSKYSTFVFTSLCLILIVTGSLFAMNYFKPAPDYTKNTVIGEVEEFIVDQVNDFRYEKKKTNSFTQGEFRKIAELELSDKQALEVVMDDPTSLYLRGYVGSQYTSDRWENLDKDVYYDAYELFYALREQEFEVLNQLSTAYQLSSTTDEADDLIGMTIHNVNANSKYLYTPYELQSSPDHFEETQTFDDSQFMSTSFFGQRLYNYETSPNIVKQYPRLANDLYALQELEVGEEYFNHESHYNEYVYEQYLRLPKEITLLLENHLDVESSLEDGHISYENAIHIVRNYLNENINYQIDPDPVPKERDFMTGLLENTREGYATHIATAGTLIVRHIGIPSRYVEGYLITPKDVEDKEEYEKINIKGTNAHAWTEIYIDTIGWIPIEVTPPYYTKMEQTDLSNYPTGEANAKQKSETSEATTGGSPNQMKEVVDQELDKQDSDRQKPEEKQSFLIYLLISLLGLAVLLIIAYLFFIIKKRGHLRKRKKDFTHPNFNIAVPKLSSYSIMLLNYNGLDIKEGPAMNYVEQLGENYDHNYVERFKEAVLINEVALFSNHTLSEEEYNRMVLFMEETKSTILRPKNIFQKMKMKYYDFIY